MGCKVPPGFGMGIPNSREVAVVGPPARIALRVRGQTAKTAHSIQGTQP